MQRLAFLFVLVLQVPCITSHLCLITPRQRGDMDISMSGSHTCSRHVAECGGQSPEQPKMQLTAGQPFFFKWQQNYNHYEVGYPGFMDLSIAPKDNGSMYTLLAVVADQHAYAQDHQQNYTAIVTVPNMQCDHCTLRARYNAHKPGETIFYQCSDVIVRPSDDQSSQPLYFPAREKQTTALYRAFDLSKESRSRSPTTPHAADSLFGIAFNPLQPGKSHYISVDAMTGRTAMVREIEYGVDVGSFFRRNAPPGHAFNAESFMNEEDAYIMDSILAVDNEHGTSNLMLHTEGDMNAPGRYLLSLNSTTGFLNQINEVLAVGAAPITWLTPYMNGKYLTFSIEEDEKMEGSFFFVVGTLGMMEEYTKLITTDRPENLYVNFQWMEKDAGSDTVYAILGNENSPDELLAKLYTFDISNRKLMRIVDLDVSKYTFMSIHSFTASGVSYLMALSPGLFGTKYPAWDLVRINPETGNVTKVCEITPPGIFEGYYGGSVYSGVSQAGMSTMYHVFRVADTQADVIATIDLLTCNVQFSQLTNLRHIHNLHSVVGKGRH